MTSVGQKIVFDHKLQSTISFGIYGVFIRAFNCREHRNHNAVVAKTAVLVKHQA